MSKETGQAAPVALVIDDEPQMRRLLRVTLEANGYRVFDAATGKDGVAQAAQRRPDVVLLDLGLPDLEGAEVLKRLLSASLARDSRRQRVNAPPTSDGHLGGEGGRANTLPSRSYRAFARKDRT